jgi:hypothetical protein
VISNERKEEIIHNFKERFPSFLSLTEEEQTQDLCETVIKIWPGAIAYIHNQTEELCMKAVTMEPDNFHAWALSHVRVQTPLIVITALAINPYVITVVKTEYLTDEVKAFCKLSNIDIEQRPIFQ